MEFQQPIDRSDQPPPEAVWYTLGEIALGYCGHRHPTPEEAAACQVTAWDGSVWGHGCALGLRVARMGGWPGGEEAVLAFESE